MPLVTLDDVRGQLPQVELGDTTRPTEEEVAKWVTEAENSLLAVIGTLTPKIAETPPPGCVYRIVQPIDPEDSPITASIVKDMVVHAVVARVLRAMLFGIGDAEASGAGAAQKYYDDRLKWMADPDHPFGLYDAEVELDCSSASTTTWSKTLGQMGGGYRPQPTMRRQF